jgi:cystathionine beta-synthase
MNDHIGDTPMLFSEFLSDQMGCTVLIKAEYANPGASSKDRIALAMIEDAEKSGLLQPGGTIVEASSGNTAIGLAWIARQKGYRCRIFLSKSCSPEKLALLQQLGAETQVCETSGGPEDPRSCQYQAQTYARGRTNTFYCDQYFNPVNKSEHYRSTGPEIWDQTNGTITHFIAGVGTGGTISGIGHYLKEQNDAISVWGVDPLGSVLAEVSRNVPLSSIKKGTFHIEGIGRHFIPGNLAFEFIDHFIQVSDEESARAAFDFRNKASFAPGFSSAAVLAALYKIKNDLTEKDVVVLFFADDGSRYKSKLYNPAWLSHMVFSSEQWLPFESKYFIHAGRKSEH